MSIQNADVNLSIKAGDASLIIAALQKIDPTGIFTIALQQRINKQVQTSIKASEVKTGEVLLQEKK